MNTLWSVIKTILLFFLLVLLELACLGGMGYLYVRLAELIDNSMLRYLFAIFWFALIVVAAKAIGKFGFSRILNKD